MGGRTGRVPMPFLLSCFLHSSPPSFVPKPHFGNEGKGILRFEVEPKTKSRDAQSPRSPGRK